MFSVSKNNVITITRGDFVTTTIYLNIGSLLDPDRYTLTDTDILYIGVMEYGQRFEDALIKYRLTSDNLNENGDVVWNIESLDTEYLEPGKYFYTIKLVQDGGRTSTVVPNTEFYIQD